MKYIFRKKLCYKNITYYKRSCFVTPYMPLHEESYTSPNLTSNLTSNELSLNKLPRSLKWLYLAETRLTRDALLHMPQSLRTLHLSGDNKITRDDVTTLAPQIKIFTNDKKGKNSINSMKIY